MTKNQKRAKERSIQFEWEVKAGLWQLIGQRYSRIYEVCYEEAHDFMPDDNFRCRECGGGDYLSLKGGN